MADILQDFEQISKPVFLDIRKQAFNMLTPAVAAARKGSPDSVQFTGTDLFFNVRLGRRGGVVSSQLGKIPGSKLAPEKRGRLGISRLYARVSVDGLALKATANPKGAMVSLAKKHAVDVMDEYKLTQARFVHGDGLGIYAIVDTVTDTTHIVVDNPYGITNAGPGNLHLTVGDVVSIRNSTGATHRGKAEITAISLSGDAATLTLGSAIASMAAGDLVCVGVPAATHSTDDSFGADPYGWKAFVDVEGNFDTFQGLNDPLWAAQKLTSASIDETVVMKLLNTIRARAGIEWRGKPGKMLLVTSTGIWQTYGESLLGLRQFVAPKMTLNGGFEAVQVAGSALLDDPWAPRSRLNAIYTPDTIFIDLMEFGDLTYEDSATWVRGVNADEFERAYGAYMNYGVTRRNSHGIISGITDTDNFSPVF